LGGVTVLNDVSNWIVSSVERIEPLICTGAEFDVVFPLQSTAIVRVSMEMDCVVDDLGVRQLLGVGK
jgi:hypothetical protein